MTTITPYTPTADSSMPVDPALIASLDDDVLALSLDAASADDRPVILAEIERRGLDV